MERERTVTDDAGSPASVHRIQFDVDFDPGHVAAYLLDGDEPTLIDAGDPSSTCATHLETVLAEIGYELGDVDHVICTHPHVDHVGLLPDLLDAGDPTVYAPASVRESFERPVEALAADVEETARLAGLPAEMADVVASWMVDRHEELFELLPETAVDVWYECDATVAVGDRRFETIHTPGHQQDHCSLVTEIEGERSLFSGDVGIRTFRSAALHAGLTAAQTEAVGAYHVTLDRLEALRVDRVYPGHGPVHDELEEAVATARESLDRLLDRTAEAVRPSGTHAGHAAKHRGGGDVDGPWLPEAIAALAHLEREGQLESALDGGVRYYTPA